METPLSFGGFDSESLNWQEAWLNRLGGRERTRIWGSPG